MGPMKKKSEGSENIRVAVRVRPISKKEIEDNETEAVTVDLASKTISVKSVSVNSRPFAFDAVFNDQFSQKDIYTQEVAPLVDSIMNGFNATVFTYGQSGSGKTWTMSGKPRDPELAGVMPNAISHILSQAEALSSPGKKYDVSISHFEIYNEKVRDLFTPNAEELLVKANATGNFYVRGLHTLPIHGLEKALILFEDSNKRRKVSATNLNEVSSRSHSIFTIYVESTDTESDPGTERRMTSKINLVDLAGSERLGKTGATGETKQEGLAINLSLTALGSVMDHLVKGDKHIPYRASILTKILQDSLGGNAKTVMFANCGPAGGNAPETKTTLQFADRAKQIKNKPIKNMDPKDAKIQALMDKIEALQKQVGGERGADFETLDELTEQNERLTTEIEGYKTSSEQSQAQVEEMRIKLEEHARAGDERILQLDAQIKELQESRDHQTTSNSEANNEVNEVKKYVREFLRGSTTKEEREGISAESLSEEAAKVIWDPSSTEEVGNGELVVALEGVRGIYAKLRKSTITESHVEKCLAVQSDEFEMKFNTFRRQQKEEIAAVTEEKANLQLRVEKISEAASNLQVEMDKATKEAERLAQKSAKENKKLEKRLQKTESELAMAQEAFEKERKEWQDEQKEASLTQARALRDQRKKMEAEREEATRALQEAKKRWEEEREDLEKSADAAQIASIKQTLITSSRLSTPEDDPLNLGRIGDHDADSVNRVMLEEINRQSEIQLQLHTIRMQYHSQLEHMCHIQKERTETAEANECLRIREECDARIAAMEQEKQEFSIQTEKQLEKALKRANKKFNQREKSWVEEKAQLEEEKMELSESNETCLRINGELEATVDSLQAKLDALKASSSLEEERARAQVKSMRQEVSRLECQLLESTKQLEDLAVVRQEKEAILAEKEEVEQLVQQKVLQLERNREMWKRSNTLLEREKGIRADAETSLEKARMELIQSENLWAQKVEENNNKLVAIHNASLQELAGRHAALLEEEQERTKAVKGKLRKAKRSLESEKNKYDSLVLANEELRSHLEEAKVQNIRNNIDKSKLELEDGNNQCGEAVKRARQQQVAWGSL